MALAKTPVSLALLVLIIAVFLGQMTGLVPAQLFAQINIAVMKGQWWRLFTGMLLHADMLHIAFNAYALWLFGPSLERAVGSAAFAALFLASGLAGGAAYLYLGSPYSSVVGASGAIFGLFGAWLASALVAHRSPTGSAQLKTLGLLLAINLALPLVVEGIAWQGHLGGLVAGFAIFMLWYRVRGIAPGSTVRALIALAVAAVILLPALMMRPGP